MLAMLEPGGLANLPDSPELPEETQIFTKLLPGEAILIEFL
jgi:hypothetical protein